MPAQLLRGAPVAARLRSEIAAAATIFRARGGGQPVLATLMIGGDASALAYRASIARAASRVGIDHRPVTLPLDTTDHQLSAALTSVNSDLHVNGVLVLMPLPAGVSTRLMLETLSPFKDIDGITPVNAGRLHLGLPSLRPGTPQGGLELLDFYGIDLAGRHTVVVGRSNVVGQPLSGLLLRRDATVTVCHRKTRDLPSFTRRADVLAVAVGSPGLITGDMVKPGATVLDFGENVVDGKLVGDVDFASVAEVAGAITPVPGGTGPVTTLVLMRNTIAAGFAALSGDLDHVELASAG